MGWAAGLMLAAGLLGSSPAHAEPNAEENFLSPSRFNVGAEGDWIFDKDLTVPGGIGAAVDSSQSYRTRLGYTVLNTESYFFELYSLLGAADTRNGRATWTCTAAPGAARSGTRAGT